ISFAPYVDMTGDHQPLTSIVRRTGQRDFVLGFVLARHGRCEPSWGGMLAVDDARLRAGFRALHALGARITVSSGGELGDYLENACSTPAALAAAYRQALDAVGADRLDLDIEHAVPAAKVNTALAALQQQRGTKISYTLPVHSTTQGLERSALPLLRDAERRRIHLTVNAMAMNFVHHGRWARAMTDAAQASVGQLRRLWPSATEAQTRHRTGLVAMIGRNDDGIVTTVEDARELVRFARASGIGHVGFWSLGRDAAGCANLRTPVETCSGIRQRPYEFTTVFRQEAR
ncbi:MAG: hypothetical protein ACRDQ5_25040, partial [Sciscionella sp.]